MVPVNILQRTFQVRHNGGTGTAFTLDVAGRQHLISARHVVEGLVPHTAVDIFWNGNWTPNRIGEIWLSDSGADLAVIDLESTLSPSWPITADATSNFTLSERVFFLGFPFGLRTEVNALNNGYPIPFVKTGIISSFAVDTENSALIFLDGHNNPGFSGGPVVTVDPQHRVTVIGVVSGYRYNDDPILTDGRPTGLTYRSNTGLIVAYTLREVMMRIQVSPNGALT